MTTPEVRLRRPFDVHSRTLANGMKVLLVENAATPTVAISVSVFTGSRYESPEKAGLAVMVSRLLDEGTKNRTSLEIAEATVKWHVNIIFSRLNVSHRTQAAVTALSRGLVEM